MCFGYVTVNFLTVTPKDTSSVFPHQTECQSLTLGVDTRNFFCAHRRRLPVLSGVGEMSDGDGASERSQDPSRNTMCSLHRETATINIAKGPRVTHKKCTKEKERDLAPSRGAERERAAVGAT